MTLSLSKCSLGGGGEREKIQSYLDRMQHYYHGPDGIISFRFFFPSLQRKAERSETSIKRNAESSIGIDGNLLRDICRLSVSTSEESVGVY